MDIFKALMNKEAYDNTPRHVKVIQTHISWVFLTGKYAYKVKKPVNFGFLDFTTLRKRAYYCRREFEINRMFSPELYISVLPIVKEAGGRVKINGNGKLIEYCIKMKEIEQSKILARIIKNKGISKSILNKIINILVNYYAVAEAGKNIDKYGSVSIIRYNWEENFEQTKSFVGIAIEKKDFELIKKEVYKFISHNKQLLRERVREGKIKWCHGDLHSANIFVDKGKVYIFDAIEFNRRFACSDIACDIAFFIMDLEFRGLYKEASYFLNKFIKATNDNKLAKLINFYKCYRAYVRGKVTSFKLYDNHIGKKEKGLAKITAAKYFDLAKRYAMNM
ncbi:MAG TPA: hypothetical protein ENG42_01510 [Candidatus Aenigmarchaeota archaeon]|nr:MAG: hypothetical protein DRP03_01320 [Candidatus Aenigmarchaeota archaeon]HDD46127.1 hypothetical protein [Candidatus Aenigmarchaeota archaeon]